MKANSEQISNSFFITFINKNKWLKYQKIQRKNYYHILVIYIYKRVKIRFDISKNI